MIVLALRRHALVAMLAATLSLAAQTQGATAAGSGSAAFQPSSRTVHGAVPTFGPERSRWLAAISAISRSDIWAVGGSGEISRGRGLIRHWDGSHWTLIRPPHATPGSQDEFDGVSAVTTSDVWAVGDSFRSNTLHPLAMHWDGGGWSPVAAPNPSGDSQFLSVAAMSTNDVWAVGDTFTGGSNGRTLIEHWDGNAWRTVASPDPGYPFSVLIGVSAVSASDVWAVGYGAPTLETSVPIAEHWDGTRWSIVATADVSGNPALARAALTTSSTVSRR